MRGLILLLYLIIVFFPELGYYGTKTRVKFNGNLFKAR